mmetsp:Transcript_13143/g.20378  ORF Transcript_13143/g.20378 Transcript_13143/m.20378 type:complete len:218 (-) Transcript_13143:14-667(-)|eukprot:scaffold1546_cov121-Skeletonema_marinoi.AAC.3
MSSRGYPKRSARAAGINTYSTSRRQRRSGAASERGVIVSTDNLGVPAVAWTKVFRHPSAPLDEPYFGRRPKASFKVPIWVRVDELTEEEKSKYDEVEKHREEQRALWKKEMEKRREEADKESAQCNELNQIKVETNEGAEEALTEVKNEITSAIQPLVAEPQTVNVGEQNQKEIAQQTNANESVIGGEILVEIPAAPTLSSNESSNGQQTEGGEPKP